MSDPDAASWSPIDTTAWHEARSAVATLRDVLLATGIAEHFPYLRADVNAFGQGFVELGRTTPEAAHHLAELLAAATADPI
ncbi:hypothetical protein [Embleya sp. NBC_00896]|uniref:hypothetical protein n=1 Tax=Embleya sp. NBC_00896 TaxID=2975961 RepID=UPI003865F9BC|nr:hypothetical protein OG928_16240 [Embleya sp. NBC_00896]WSY13178.1 hypothetical protein OG928_16285 [Embleya sp. NBC_00896]WSY13187.1 hypothetical protein OG928_16330 [Embleya sp. NBC_00896]